MDINKTKVTGPFSKISMSFILLPGNIMVFHLSGRPAGQLTHIKDTCENDPELCVSQLPALKTCAHLWCMMLSQPLYLSKSLTLMYYPPPFSFNSFSRLQSSSSLFGVERQGSRWTPRLQVAVALSQDSHSAL